MGLAWTCVGMACAQQPQQTTDSLAMYDKEADLGEVAVVAHVPMVKMTTDKMTYQVKNDADAKTQTVLQMLRKVPMVTVDGKNNISVNGSREFKVYVDGRLSTTITRNPTQVFRNMPASGVQSIEVITNPGARYDAEGVGGVLNIITKKKKNLNEEVRELNGTVSTTASLNNWGMETSLSGQHIRYRERFLIAYRDTFITIPACEVSHIGIKDGVVHLYTIAGKTHTLNITLDELESQLDPTRFIRANRQFIVSATAIEKLSTFFLGKMRIHLKGYPNADIIVSRDKVAAIKRWLDT